MKQTDIKHDVPFIENPWHSCVPVSMLSGMLYYKPGLKLGLDDLYKIMQQNARKGEGAFTYQVARAFTRLGWRYQAYAKDVSEVQPDPDSRPHRTWLIEEQHLTVNGIRRALEKNHLPLCCVDYNKLHPGRFKEEPHMIVVVGYDRGDVVYHENGSIKLGDARIPFCRISARKFELARREQNYETIVLKGPARDYPRRTV